jgi:1-acyl-sn-glycerol-3-phosphate acyltransferase
MIERIRGLENVDPNVQYVIAPLHEGFADPLLLAHLPLDLRFVVRDELFEWKWLGRGLRVTDQIMVKPESRIAGYRQLLAEAESTFALAQSLVMFPQGSILGIESSFRRGPFRIADRLDKAVLPVVITGTHRVWEHPYTNRLRFGQTVSMHVFEPLPVGGAVDGMREVERRMKQVALSPETASPRRFDPERDGYWDDYSYEIDPDFPEVAELVARHRLAVGRESEIDTPMDGVGPT